MRKFIIQFVIFLACVAFGYFWAYKALGHKTYSQPAGWVASDEIKSAMLKMGPRHNYRMVGETLYVDTGQGWQRLRY